MSCVRNSPKCLFLIDENTLEHKYTDTGMYIHILLYILHVPICCTIYCSLFPRSSLVLNPCLELSLSLGDGVQEHIFIPQRYAIQWLKKHVNVCADLLITSGSGVSVCFQPMIKTTTASHQGQLLPLLLSWAVMH